MQPNKPDEDLGVVAAIADGTPIDWARLFAGRPDEARALESLRLLDEITSANRRLLNDAELAEHAGHAEPTPPPANADWGSLRLIERIGEGGFGEVFRAYDPGLRAEVALKLLRAGAGDDARAEERFLDEASRLARVRHPNVLIVHGAARHDGRAGMWTDLVKGETLEAMLESRGTLGAREAAGIGIELCHALAAVHRAGLVHRDVKAANIMREQGGRILLMDFGTVAELTAGAAAQDAGLYGTPLSMAPEQVMGAPVGTAADIYALGVLLYRLVSGCFPIEAQTYEDLRARHAIGERVPLRDRRPDLPADFIRVVERCLEQDPARRYASAGALERELEACIGLERRTDDEATNPLRRYAFAGVALAVAVIAVLVIPRVWKPGPGVESPNTQTPHESQPLTATATLYRSSGGSEQPLLPGARVEPGTRLSLRFECAESSFVYVLNEDETGHAFVLFPLPGIEPANPLGPRRPHRLPGTLAGEFADWTVTSAGGRESIVLIASRHALPELERDLSSIAPAKAGAPVRYPALSPDAVMALRGIGGLERESTSSVAKSKGRIAEALAHVRPDGAAARDLWIWEAQLPNPERR